MSRNDVVMTPLRVKQAIDSRFVKPSEDELNVLINGTWVEFVKVGGEPDLPPAVNCADLLTMYKGDTTLIETPLINATGCTSLKEVFRECSNLVTVKYIHMPNVTNMDNTFRDCSSLTSIPELDMSNVTHMQSTFRNCSSLTALPRLDVSNAVHMASMFMGCSSLTSVTFVGGVVPPYGKGMFKGTPIASGNGQIFVPDELVDAYKSADGWSTHASIIRGISEWYDTLGFTEFIPDASNIAVATNEVQYTEQEMLDILPFYVKWNGTFTNVETGETVGGEYIPMYIMIDDKRVQIPYDEGYEIIVRSDDLPDLSEEGVYTFIINVDIKNTAPSKVLADGYFELRENDANGVLIGHYPLHYILNNPCYLTSAMVGYYGKPDDGVELTAMRRLREVYAEKHAETLKTYYEDSAIIISEIERLDMEDYYYGRIKDVVDEIVIHVENENWSVAEGLYLDLYYGLKDELM